ncbi:helix-turn-helix domain-containing protein [Krasilnikovia sp. M28-CT-15]|uniref:helix-turn-helix domain-containing protein n=1 Tax=Krasilnikovia sp. M28-CT-15 TaxID=3373540 RepID=UPI003876569F
MPADPIRLDEARTRLADLVTKRRQALGLSVRAAAEASGLSRITWGALEDGSRRTGDSKFAGIERALKWDSGSVAAILNGGDPTPVMEDTPPPGPGDALRKVMNSDDLTETEKRQIIRLLVAEQLAEEQARAAREAARADELIDMVRALRSGVPEQ